MNEFVEKNVGKNSDIYEVNLIEVARKIGKKWKFIFKVMSIFICLGIFQFFYQKENPIYTVESVLLVNTGNKNVDIQFAGEGSMNDEIMLPLSLYPKIVHSSPFLKELMSLQVQIVDSGESMTFAEFCVQKKYLPLCFKDKVRKYTIGLPEMFGEENCPIMDSSMIENICITKLKEEIKCNVNIKENVMILSMSSHNSLVAEQMVLKMQKTLAQYISKLNLQNVEKNLYFLQKHYDEVIQKITLIQNDQKTLQVGHIPANILQKYNVLEVLGTKLGVQLEQAKIQSEEVFPIFKMIDSTTVRLEKHEHGIVVFSIIFAFLGGFIGICLVLILPFVAQRSDCNCLKSWIPEK